MILRLLLLFCLAGCLSAQTIGQYEIRKRGSTGYTSYGVTLSNGQVIGLTAGVPAAITPFDGAFGSLSGKPTTLSGYGITDAQASSANLTILAAGGGVLATYVPIWNHSAQEYQFGNLPLTSLGLIANNTILGNVSGGTTNPTALTASEVKTMLSLSNVENTALSTWAGTTNVTTLGTISTGTWNGTAIALGYIAQGGAMSGQVLSWNGTAWAPAASVSGLTIGTTAISGGTSGRVLYDNAGVVGEIATTGSGNAVLHTAPTFATSTTSPNYYTSNGNAIYGQTSGLGMQIYSNAYVFIQPGPGSYAIVADYSSTTLHPLVVGHLKFGSAWNSLDAGMTRTSSGTLKITNGSTGYGALLTGSLTVGGNGTAIAQIKRFSVTLVAGTATVSDTDTTANTVVLMSVITPGGAVGHLDYDVSAGSSYTINSDSGTDTSTVNITVIHFP